MMLMNLDQEHVYKSASGDSAKLCKMFRAVKKFVTKYCDTFATIFSFLFVGSVIVSVSCVLLSGPLVVINIFKYTALASFLLVLLFTIIYCRVKE